MTYRSNLKLAFLLALVFGLAITTIPVVQAKSLVGTSCTQAGAMRGDGPGKSIICKVVGKKKIWQIYKKTSLPTKAPTNGGSASPTSSPSVSPSPVNSQASSCQQPPQFTRDFIDPKFVRVVTPIGEQTGSGGVIAVRSYVHPAQEFLGQELPIYAPVDMTLFQASYYKPPGSAADYKPEYSLYFTAGCGILVKFFHIKGVVGKVAAVVPTEASPSSAGQNVTSTQIAAGEQIGWYKLGPGSVAFDFWVDDTSITNKFIVQSHFSNSNALHSVCPYNFYTKEKQTVWLSKLGAPGSNPIPGTGCGSISQGVLGTADGMWFISESTLNDNLTTDGAYQSQIMFSTDPSGLVRIGGLNASGAPAQMMISPNTPSWKKPTDILVGETHCWATEMQSVRVQVISDRTMSVLVGAGTCDSLNQAGSARTYYR